jgi:hypothetical protein
VIVARAVDHLRYAADFVGNYVSIQPEGVHGRDRTGQMSQSEHGVVLHLSRIQTRREGLEVRLSGERLTSEWP